jgi:hypothetical protein
MNPREVDPHHYIRTARQIKARLPGLLSQWGLAPKFKRWRLAQDPENGMVVLFSVLDNKYIARHTTTPFGDYFDPRVLNDLARELQVKVIPSANDGLRYAFVLESGDPLLPAETPSTTPAGDGILIDPAPQEPIEPLPAGRHPVRYARIGLIEKRSRPRQPHSYVMVDDVSISHHRLARFLKVNHALNAAGQPLPDVLLMDQAEFNQKMADLENNRRSLSN